MADAPKGLAPDYPLPALREDIRLLPGTRSWTGEPTWTLADPLRNRFFQLGERDIKLLNHWSQGTPEALLLAVNTEPGVDADLEDVNALLGFLMNAELVDAAAAPLRQRLISIHKAREQTLFQQLLHKYLFFRIPLIRPDRLLDRLYPNVRFLFQPWFLRMIMLVGLLGMFLVAQNWERFTEGFGWFLTPAGMAVFAVILVVVKMIHETGHALMLKHYGLRVPTMGVAFLVMWPVLYTDASEGWRLQSRRQRAMIAAAGVITEMILACFAMVAWFFLPDGTARSIAFAVATTTWVLSVAVNLNPLMRFDGYYFLSDIVNIPNLQDRSFAVARWRLRQWLFGVSLPAPEHFPERTLSGMVIYAWAIWIYRFFLFLGIAVLVYYFFFKALGIFLFGVEIWWFIVRPIWNEIKQWRQLAPGTDMPRRRLFIGIGVGLLLLLAFPWKSSIELPALLSAEKHARMYVPVDAQVVSVQVRDGELVKAGQPLMTLVSPELEIRIRLADVDIKRMEGLVASAAMQAELYQDRLVLDQELLRAQAVLSALQRELEKLTVRAPYDGVVRDLESEFSVGSWLPAGRHLLTVVAPGSVEVTAWLSERDRDRVSRGNEAVFWTEGRRGPQGVALVVKAVDTGAVRDLDPPFHASLFGGDIAVTEAADGSLVPQSALYRVRLAAVEPASGAELEHRWRGWVIVDGQRQSLLLKGLTWLAGAVIRESGL
jgi:putative peptide zinc metalloprotease protein